ncbi:MAG: AraC family transcriptional regulator [Bacteroidaceae bacterium]|nr:AraC family transcriptional regulator [Bacteroidaceae bacterium]
MSDHTVIVMMGIIIFLLAGALAVFVVLFIRRDKALHRYLFPDHTVPGSRSPDAKLLRNLKEMMEQERVFTDCTLNLEKLAKQLGTNRSTLSRAVNTGLGVNFTTFLNSYRIKEAIRIINEESAHSSLKIESIGHLCGFNTRQAFHRAFKQETGMNMRQYLKNRSGLIQRNSDSLSPPFLYRKSGHN